jgi:predicted Zn-dependent protease
VAYVVLQPKLRAIQAKTEKLRASHAETDRMRLERAPQQVQPSSVPATANALEAARAAVRQTPTSADANLHLASLLVRSKAEGEAVPYAETAAQLAPHDAHALQLLGNLYERQGHLYDAMQIYRKLLERAPDNIMAINRLGWLYISFGWSKEACALLEPAVRTHPHYAHLKVELALACMQSHDYQLSEQLLESVRAEYPDRSDLWLSLADLYNKRANYDRAVAVLRDGLKLHPDTLLLLQSLAQAQFDSGDIAGSTATWNRLLALAPDSAAVHYGLALIYRKDGRTADAIHELDTVARLGNGYSQAQLVQGQLYLQTGRAAEGARLLRDYEGAHARTQEVARVRLLLVSKPTDPTVHLQMARIHQQENDIPRMIVELHRTLELDPANAQAKRLLEQASLWQSANGSTSPRLAR